MLYNYSITPLAEDHFEERCADIINTVKTNVITVPLFLMQLVPEGNPVWDKVTPLAKLFAKYRDALAPHGIKCGILLQSSIGHCDPIVPNPFVQYVGLKDGKEQFTCCPEDDTFMEHFSKVLITLAKEHPSAIMLDDDVRLMMHPGRGCACHLHMKEFNKRTGLNMTREELSEHIFSHREDDPLTDVFRDIQTDSLIKLVTGFRKAIDSVDPTIQGVCSTSGHVCEAVMYTSKIFAGKGNPSIVRIPNGSYAPLSTRNFGQHIRQNAICGSRLRKAGVDILLAETDTVPYNRYGKSARLLHSHYTVSMLDGLQGAKHWISRFKTFEPESGKAYRDILAQNYKLYEKLFELSGDIRWVGAEYGFIEQKKVMFHKERFRNYHNCAWISKNLERMGLPISFNEHSGKAIFLEDTIGADMSDEQIAEKFKGSVFMTAQVANDLAKRGYTDLTGVEIEDCDLGCVFGESLDGTPFTCCTKQKNLKKINIVRDNVEILSYNYTRENGEFKTVSPAVTVYRRPGGQLSVTYCGSPDAEFTYDEGFAFLNETRKNQFVALLKEAGALPIYCVGDDEICFRAGYLGEDRMLAAVFELGIDPMDSLKLYLEKAPKSICMLDCNGEENAVEFSPCGDSIYDVKVRIEPMNPVILIIR